MSMTVTLEFEFYQLAKDVIILELSRTSTWAEERNDYLMPSEFQRVVPMEEDKFLIIVKSLDPAGVMSDSFVGKKFYFGHPGRVIGYGILIKYGGKVMSQ